MAISCEKLHQINPNSICLLIPHSRGGALTKNAIEGLSAEQRQRMCTNSHIFAMAPLSPIPRKGYAASAINVYSEEDHITDFFLPRNVGNNKKVGAFYEKHDIRFLKPLTRIQDRMLYIADHSFLGATNSDARENYLRQLGGKYEFYHGQSYEKTR